MLIKDAYRSRVSMLSSDCMKIIVHKVVYAMECEKGLDMTGKDGKIKRIKYTRMTFYTNYALHTIH